MYKLQCKRSSDFSFKWMKNAVSFFVVNLNLYFNYKASEKTEL